MAGNVQVTSRVELNMSVLAMLDGAQYTALAQTADATLTELRDRGVMPFDTGNLQNDSTFVDDSQKTTVSIVSTSTSLLLLSSFSLILFFGVNVNTTFFSQPLPFSAY